MQFRKNKGCEFLTNKCVDETGNVNDNFKNEFFSQVLYYGSIDPGCSSGRQSRAYHAIYEYEENVALWCNVEQRLSVGNASQPLHSQWHRREHVPQA